MISSYMVKLPVLAKEELKENHYIIIYDYTPFQTEMQCSAGQKQRMKCKRTVEDASPYIHIKKAVTEVTAFDLFNYQLLL